ncbi:MAG: hypothetical protein V1899_05540 [Planctomycetota bacterium]
MQLFFLGLAMGLALSAWASENDSANLRLRIASGETLRYSWQINSNSESSGRELGKPFTLTANSSFSMTLALKGLPRKSDNAILVSLHLQDLSYNDKRSIGAESRIELNVSKGRIKYTENDKVIADSENDIGMDRIGDYQRHITSIENGEMRATLDATGRQTEVQGESSLIETIKSQSQAIFPILAGKEVKPGESWDDELSMPQLGDFKLAKPAIIRSKMTFAKWEVKDGRRLALIELASAWEKQDLKGENNDGLLVEITKVNGRSIGVSLFDPDTGQFVEGEITVSIKYRIDGERDGQATGLEVSGKTIFKFMRKTNP